MWSCLSDFICKDFIFRGYTHSTTEPCGSFAQGDRSWESWCSCIVPKKSNEMKADLQNSTSSRGDRSWESWCSCIVPKKSNEMKADLQNSTSSQGDRSWEDYCSLRQWNLLGSTAGVNRYYCFPAASP